MVAMGPIYAGVELGGTKCICLLARGPDDVLAREQLPTRRAGETLDEIGSVLDRWRSEYAVSSLGIASFGPLDLDRGSPAYGRLTTTPKPGWGGADLLELADGLPCAIDTDVNAAALAEGLWGAAQGISSWCYITIGTGVGVGTIIDRNPIHGLGHSEAGHMRVPSPGTRQGSCKFHRDCVEGFLSGPAIEARAGIPAGKIPADHPVWDEAAEVLAVLCHNLAFTVLPQRIVVGGGVPQRRPDFLANARKRLERSLGGYSTGAFIAQASDNYLAPAGLGNDAGSFGAIALATSAHRS